MKYTALLLSTIIFLNGCAASSEVHSIGARAIHGLSTSSLNDSKQITIDLIDSEQNMTKNSYPFQLVSDTEGTKVVNVRFDYKDIVWETQDHIKGNIELDINGKLLKFNVIRRGKYIELTREYRETHGKILQILYLASIPIDIAFSVIGIGVVISVLIVILPIKYISDLILPNDKKESIEVLGSEKAVAPPLIEAKNIN